MRIRTFLLLLGAAALLSPLHASVLAGDTIHVAYDFPTYGTVYADMGTNVAPGSFIYLTTFTLTVNDTSIVADSFTHSGGWVTSSFNGWVLFDLTNSWITGVTVDPSTNMSGFSASNVTFSGNTVAVNWQGLSFTTSTRVQLNLTGSGPGPDPGPAPEPGTLAMLAGGLGVGVFSLRRKKA